jgi:hypothetical protein
MAPMGFEHRLIYVLSHRVRSNIIEVEVGMMSQTASREVSLKTSALRARDLKRRSIYHPSLLNEYFGT